MVGGSLIAAVVLGRYPEQKAGILIGTPSIAMQLGDVMRRLIGMTNRPLERVPRHPVEPPRRTFPGADSATPRHCESLRITGAARAPSFAHRVRVDLEQFDELGQRRVAHPENRLKVTTRTPWSAVQVATHVPARGLNHKIRNFQKRLARTLRQAEFQEIHAVFSRRVLLPHRVSVEHRCGKAVKSARFLKDERCPVTTKPRDLTHHAVQDCPRNGFIVADVWRHCGLNRSQNGNPAERAATKEIPQRLQLASVASRSSAACIGIAGDPKCSALSVSHGSRSALSYLLTGTAHPPTPKTGCDPGDGFSCPVSSSATRR